MIVECSWNLPGCVGRLPDKERLEDERTTHTLCDSCAVQVHAGLTERGRLQVETSQQTTRAYTYTESVSQLNASMGASFWLRESVKRLERRDCVDACRDAETLVTLARKRMDEATVEANESTLAMGVLS